MQLNFFESQLNLSEVNPSSTGGDGKALMNGTLPNEHGVFCSGYEVLSFSLKPSKPWAGGPEIELAQLNNGNWIGEAGFKYSTGGQSGPLTIHDKQYNTKQECFTAMLQDLIRALKARIKWHGDESASVKECRRMIKWAETEARIEDFQPCPPDDEEDF